MKCDKCEFSRHEKEKVKENCIRSSDQVKACLNSEENIFFQLKKSLMKEANKYYGR